MTKDRGKKDLAHRATVAIAMALRGSLHLIGTGLLVDVEGCLFVVTAGHVVKGSEKYEARLGLVDMVGNFITLKGDWKYSTARNYGTMCDPIDVAIHRLEPCQRSELGEAIFLNMDHMALTPEIIMKRYYLYGFPFSRMERDETERNRLLLKPLLASFSLYCGPTCSIGEYKERFHLLLDARHSNMQDVSHECRQRDCSSFLPSVRGISGSGIWGEDTQKREKIVALQTGVYHRQQIIKATRWIMVMRLLYDSFPGLGSNDQ